MTTRTWQVGDTVRYVNEDMTVTKIDGLFCDLRNSDGRTLQHCSVGLLGLPSTARTMPVMSIDWPLTAICDESLKAEMTRPVNPPEPEPPEPRMVPAPVVVAAGKRRRYRPEGYRCDLCPDLVFEKSHDKARHCRSAHPTPAPAAETVVQVQSSEASTLNFLVAERDRLRELVDALDVVIRLFQRESSGAGSD